MKSTIVEQFLNHTRCHRCNSSLRGSQFVVLAETPVVVVVYTSCHECGGELLATLGVTGQKITALRTDLTPGEIRKFFGARAVSPDDVLAFHALAKRGDLWPYLKQKREQFWENKQKNSAEGDLSRLFFMEKDGPQFPSS